MDYDVLGQAVHEVAALDLEGHLGVHRVGRADLDLDLLGGALTDEEVILAFDEGDDGLVEHIAGHADAAGSHDEEKFEDIDFSKLPERFVLKCTHDSGGVIVCKDKSKLNYKKVHRKINGGSNRGSEDS